ncbi:MAG TPA: ABC transporter substrate-binding protein [Kineosporiaceae bacterium]
MRAGPTGRSGRRAMALLSAAAVVALAACSGGGSGGTGATSSPSKSEGTPVKGGTLNMLGSGDVDYMDPNITYYTAGYEVFRLVSRTPYTYPAVAGQTEKSVPDLATGNLETGADGMSATWHIREGAKWNTSPARQVTAEDAIRGIKRACNPVQPFGGLPDFETLIVGYQAFCDGFTKVSKTSAAAVSDYLEKTPVSGLKVGGDDRTVQITLTQPVAYLQDMMTLQAFAPAPKEYDAYLPNSPELAQHIIADGPYAITTYTATKRIELGRNPAWNAATDDARKAYVDKIVIDETVSQESQMQQLQTATPTADMQFDVGVPSAQIPALVAANDPNFTLGPTTSSNPFITFNLISPNNNNIMAKKEFRQALMYGLNRTTIIQATGGPKVNPPLTHVLPPSVVGGEKDFDPYPHDVNKAKQLLAQAGFPSGGTLKFLYRNASQGSSKTFATVQQDLKEVGINVVGVPSPNADFYTKYLQTPSTAQRGVWDLALPGWGTDWYGNAAASYFLPLFSGKPSFPPAGSNWFYYDSPNANALIAKASKAKTADEAKPLWADADKAVMDDAPFFPITNSKWPNYKATQVHNAVFLDYLQNYDPANVWLDPAKNGG